MNSLGNDFVEFRSEDFITEPICGQSGCKNLKKQLNAPNLNSKNNFAVSTINLRSISFLAHIALTNNKKKSLPKKLRSKIPFKPLFKKANYCRARFRGKQKASKPKKCRKAEQKWWKKTAVVLIEFKINVRASNELKPPNAIIIFLFHFIEWQRTKKKPGSEANYEKTLWTRITKINTKQYTQKNCLRKYCCYWQWYGECWWWLTRFALIKFTSTS